MRNSPPSRLSPDFRYGRPIRPDEITVQDMKKVADNSSLGIKVIGGMRVFIAACSLVKSAVLSSA